MTTTVSGRPNALQIDSRDNVAVALDEIPKGAGVILQGKDSISALNSVPFAHKVALCRISAGEPVIKYGAAIAFATADIQMGEWVHEHNARSFFGAKRETNS
jgi:altronate dehydratase